MKLQAVQVTKFRTASQIEFVNLLIDELPQNGVIEPPPLLRVPRHRPQPPGPRRPVRAATDGPLLVLAIGSLPLLLLELERSLLPTWDRRSLDAVNVAVLVAFATDYLVELAVCGNRRRYVRRDWTSLVIVATQAVALAPGLAGLGALRAARGARAVRAVPVTARLLAVGGAPPATGVPSCAAGPPRSR
jgi:hypothetical protein